MEHKFRVVHLVLALLVFGGVTARIHKLEIRDDVRRYIALTTFGFYKGGILNVNLTNFKTHYFGTPNENDVFGFTLKRTLSNAMNPYLDNHQEKCLLQGITSPRSELDVKDDSSVIYFTMDFKSLTLKVNCSQNLHSIHIYKNASELSFLRHKRGSASTSFSDTVLFPMKKRNTMHRETNSAVDVADGKIGVNAETGLCSQSKLPMTMETVKDEKYYSTSFSMRVTNDEAEGLYNLYFHSCPNYPWPDQVAIDFTNHIKHSNAVIFSQSLGASCKIQTERINRSWILTSHFFQNPHNPGLSMQIAEENNGNFLSAGEMPLPTLYFMMALLFFLSGSFWVFILKKSKHEVFKIHILMAVLVYLKSLSLLFHGINYHFIQTKGEHVAAWAILFYITHLLKGAVLFITIVLVGTGWDFINHILADKDKKLFMIVIPLQVLANVAEIIIEESEEGDVEHNTWRYVFILVDLICCGVILFPVVWSIRHLRESAHTDGKAAINLRKLKLFRHFYIMIFCYIYFTRIIVHLLKMTVPFQYEWLDEMFREMATYVFFVLTGYKFRPASANPYFTVTDDDDLGRGDDDDDMDVVVSGASGLTEGLNKTKATKIVRPMTSELIVNDEEREVLIGKRESSHEYD